MYLCTVNHLLDNHTIDARMRYESHRLIYTIPNDEPTELGGILAAAILAVLLVDTPEGDARAIALQSEDEQADFFRRYNREVLRDDWGYLAAEVNQLRENYIQIAVGSIKLNDICPNRRQLGLALDLMTTYMRQLVVSTYGEHIWDVFPYQAPFPQWLINAARIETRRQRFLHTDWTDMPAVTRLAEMPDETEPPTFCFEGEKAEDIMARRRRRRRRSASGQTIYPKRCRNTYSTISGSLSNILPISARSLPPSMPCANWATSAANAPNGTSASGSASTSRSTTWSATTRRSSSVP